MTNSIFDEVCTEKYWKFFKEISDIPRRSGEEKKIAEYLVNFAKARNLKYAIDDIFNVVIWKEASKGKEGYKTLGLQCHTDMICEKDINVVHDFLNDPIELVVDGDYVRANGTTLGADNGIGIAYMLAILDSNNLETPKLECIFTVQEETTMEGVIKLNGEVLSSKKIISLDNFSEDEMWIGSATAKEWKFEINGSIVDLGSNDISYRLEMSNFKGGHSGLDIGDDFRANPIKLCAELLGTFDSVQLNNINGGSAINVIPRGCIVEFSISRDEAKKIDLLNSKIDKIRNTYKGAEISVQKIEDRAQALDIDATKKVINFISGLETGGIKRDSYGNVILSGNLAKIMMDEATVIIEHSIRINHARSGEELVKRVLDNIKEYSVDITDYFEVIGYEQDENSELVKICEDTYKEIFNRDIKKVKVQACLECGYLAQKVDGLEYIAICSNIYDAHSPAERVSISSTNRMWNFIVELIKSIK